MAPQPLAGVLAALRFAAEKHRGQMRKGVDGCPYINHPIDVAELLARSSVDELVTLQGALLHDTLEDTDTTAAELAAKFGEAVRDLVIEVSDDPSQPKRERKRLQLEHAPHLGERARRIKIADKTCNILDIAHSPPHDWSRTRRVDYIDWAEAVVSHCLGVGPAPLEAAWHEALREARQALSG